MSTTAYVGLGSNLGDPRRQVERASAALQRAFPDRFRMSRLYASKAIGPGEQPDYVNAVAGFDTVTTAAALLDTLHEIENAHGRVRAQRWGARTLDLDLLVFGDLALDEPQLQLPHPHLAERPFVLYPLLELAPDLHVPGLGPLSALAADCPFEHTWLLDHG